MIFTRIFYQHYAPINYCSIHKKVSYENKCPNTSMSYKIYFQRNLILVHNSHIHPQTCKDFDRCMKIVFLAKPFINSYFTCIYMIYKCHIKLYRSFFPRFITYNHVKASPSRNNNIPLELVGDGRATYC